MKDRLLRWLPSAAFFVFLPGCFITNNLGIQPAGAYSGLELKTALADRGFINFTLGVYGYCEQYSNSGTCRRAAGDEISRGALISYFVLPAKVAELERIEDDAFYTGQSAEKCLSKVGSGLFLTVNAMITNNATKDTTGSVTDESIRKGVELAVPVAPVVAAFNCYGILEEPGPLIYLGRTDKVFGGEGDGDGEGEGEGDGGGE